MFLASSTPVSELQKLGVGIVLNAQQRLHVGILYSNSNSEIKFCHLAFHHLLKDEPANALPKLFWQNCGLDLSNQQVVAAWISNLSINAENIPYGFDSSGSCFDSETGAFLGLPIGKGLTCATFVLAAFKSLGFILIDSESWPDRPEDVEWQNEIIESLDGYCKYHGIEAESHIAALKSDIGAKRIRPDEAAAGVIADETPIEFTEARESADKILQSIAASKLA